jgi:Mannosyltransferase (PIG-V)
VEKTAVDSPSLQAAVVAAGEQPLEARLFARAVWRDALLVWAGQRLLILTCIYLGATAVKVSNTAQPLTWQQVFSHWFGWDGSQYAPIAEHGYVYSGQSAFFPLLPMLEHVLAALTGGNAALAGLVITNVACLAFFVVVRVLAERECGRTVARRSLVYLALFPTAFFLAAPYTEALLLLFATGSFLALRQGKWLVAGLLAARATLARAPGILLILPLVFEAVRRAHAAGTWPSWRERGALLAAVSFPLAALAAFTVYLHARFGQWGAMVTAQSDLASDRRLNWPWVGFLRAGRRLAQDGFTPSYFQAHILLDIAFTLLFIALALVAVRHLPAVYAIFCWAALVLVLCTPAHNWYALSSNMRYLLAAFPLFWLFGRWGADRRFELAYLGIALPLFTLFVVTFAAAGWVA